MFHVYQVATVEDGIEILTSVPAGRPDPDGRYPEGTVYYKVQEKLKKYLERSMGFKKEFQNTKD